MSNVQVAVRVRPFNDRERAANSGSIISMTGPTTVIRNPALEGPAAFKQFSYDYSYWSIDESNPENYADQERVFKDLGINILDNAFTGFNCSIFAYGQTGAGKSYSMLGYGADKGLIPKVCEDMYRRIDKIQGPDCQVNVEVSFFEIYNENVFDLLNPTGNKSGLKVRNHPTTGPYVEDLSRLAVQSYDQIDQLMEEGSKARTVASTNMNATSSRSHAVFTIVLTITKGTGRAMVSKIHMVDLAGSERATATGASGQRLKEGANINKSLSTLGKVIAALAKKSDGKKNVFVPYRDSVLTWLLKESLGGNSKTIMLAAISPADINFEETLSTLRYADSAKQIKNAAVVNEDPTEKLIRELQEEVERLRQLLAEKEREVQNMSPRAVAASSDSPPDSITINGVSSSSSLDHAITASDATPDSIFSNTASIAEIKSQLMQSTKLMATLGKSWETKLAETDALQKERKDAFEVQGLGSSLVDQNLPNLVNLNEDPLLSGALVYYLRKGETQIGHIPKKAVLPSPDRPQASILLGGLGVAADHCLIVYDGQEVWLHPRQDAPTFVNGIRLSTPRKLVHGCRVIIGANHIFRFNHPESAQRRTEEELVSTPPTLSGSIKPIDYKFALEERASAEVDALMANTLHFDLSSEEEKLLEKQMKEYYEQKRVEMDDIDKQLENLKKSKDSVLDAIDYEQSRQELQTRKVSIELELSKQKEKFASFSFRVWNEKLERQQLKESIARLIVLIEEANAISKELDKQIHYELLLRSSHPTHSIAETLFESGFGLYKRMIFEVRGIDLRDGRYFDWSQSSFSDLVEDMRSIYSSYLTADDEQVEEYIGPVPLPNPDSDSIVEPSPFNIPSQEDALRMFTHVNLRDLLYLNHTTIQAPVMDMNGKVYGQLHVELDRIAGESASPRQDSIGASGDQVDSLIGREIEIVLRINKFTGLDLPAPSLYCSYQFWNSYPYKTEIGTLTTDGEQSQTGATLNFFHEERFIISNAREDFLAYLENDPLVVELWSVHGTDTVVPETKFNLEALRKAYAASERDFSAQSDDNGITKQAHASQEQKEERYRMLASIMIQESMSPPNVAPEYKNVATKQEPWNSPSVQFRLRRTVKSARKVIFQTAQLKGHPMSIESCEQVTLTIYPQKPAGSVTNTTGTMSPSTSSAELLSSSPTISSPLSSAVSMTPTVLNLKVISVNDDRVEVEWEEASNVLNTERANLTGTPRRRGRSAAVPPSSDSVTGDGSGPAPMIARSGSGLGVSGMNSTDDFYPPMVGELSFTLKLNRLAIPVRVTKPIGLKFVGAERVRQLSRTTSEVQMIEDLKMKEILKTQDEQLAMSGSHFQLTFQQYRTVAKQVSVMIEEQKNTQKLVAAALLHDRLLNELALVEKLGTLQTLDSLNRSMTSLNTTDPGSSAPENGSLGVSSNSTHSAASHFIQVRYPRTKEDISKSISIVQQRIGELSGTGNPGNGKDDVSVQVSISDVNNRMESKVCGYLSKKAGKIWKSRWCVLSKLYFQVYKTEEDEDPRDILDLTNARVNDTSSSRYPHSFAIVNWKDVWFFQAQNPDDFKRWMDALDPERAIRELQSTKEKSLQSKLESTTKALKDSNDQVKSSTAELAEAHDTILKREEEIVVLTNEVESLQSRVKILETDIEALQIAPVTASSTEPNGEKLDSDGSVDQAAPHASEEALPIQPANTEEIDRLKLELEEAQLKILDLEDTVLDLQSNLERVKKTVKLLEEENADTADEAAETMQTMKEKLSKMESQILDLDVQLESKDDEVRSLQRDLTKKEREIEKLSSSANVASELEEETKKQVDEWKKKHASVVSELEDSESKLSQKERELARKDKEVASHQETIENLERQVAKLKKSAAAATPRDTEPPEPSPRVRNSARSTNEKDRAEVQELKSVIKKLTEDLAEKSREIRSMEFEHQKQLREVTVDLKSTADMHQYDLEQKERELAKKTAELASKVQMLADAETELDDAADLVHELKRAVATKDKTITEKQKEIEKRDRELHQLKQTVSSDKAKFAQQAQESASSHSHLMGMKGAEEAEREKREAQLKKKGEMIEELQAEVEKLSKSAADYRAEAKESKRAASEAQKEISRKEAQLASKVRHIDELSKRVQDLERELQDSERSAKDFRSQLASKSRDVTDLESSVESWRDKVDATKRLVEERERDIEEKTREFEDLTADYEELQGDCQSIQRELDQAGRQINQLDEVCFDLQRKLETALQRLEDAENDDEKGAMVRDHKKQAAQWASDLADRDRDVERAEQSIKQLEKTLSKREKKIHELEDALSNQNAKIGVVSASASKDAGEVSSLKREIASKDAQLKRMQEDLEYAQREAKRAQRRLDTQAEISTPVVSRTRDTANRKAKDTDSDTSEPKDRSSDSSKLEKLRSKLEEANKSIVRLETESARKSAQIERLERDRTTQKALLSDLEASVQSTKYQSSSNRRDSRVEELQSQLNDAMEQASKQAKKAERAYKLELADKNNQIDLLRRRIETAQSAAQSAIRTRAPISETAEPVVIETIKADPEMEKELFQLREKVLSLQSQLRSRLSELEDVQSSTRRQDSSSKRNEEKLEAEKERMEAKISSLEREVVQLRTRLQVRGIQVSAHSSDPDEVPIDWKIRCQQAEREMETLRQELRQSTNGTKLPIYPDIHTKVLKGEVEVLKESAGAKSDKIAELRGRQKELQEERIALKSEALSLQKEKTEAASTAAASTRQAARLQEQVASLQSRLDESTRIEKSLRKQNDELSDERVALVLAVKKAQIEVLAATGKRLEIALPSSLDMS